MMLILQEQINLIYGTYFDRRDYAKTMAVSGLKK